MDTLQIGAESHWVWHVGAASILYLHIAGGSIAILAGAAAVAVRKGGGSHRLAGHVFFVSMLVMATIGAAVAPFLASAQGDPKRSDAIVAAFTCYLVATGWATVRRKAGTVGAFEKGAFAFAALLATLSILIGMQATGDPDGLVGGSPGQAYFVLGGIIALAAALDLKVILQGGTTGAPRLARHLWRMCVAFFIATGSLFIGQQDILPAAVRGSPVLFVLGFAPFGVMAFWLVRLRFARAIGRLSLRIAPPKPAVEAAE